MARRPLLMKTIAAHDDVKGRLGQACRVACLSSVLTIPQRDDDFFAERGGLCDFDLSGCLSLLIGMHGPGKFLLVITKDNGAQLPKPLLGVSREENACPFDGLFYRSFTFWLEGCNREDRVGVDVLVDTNPLLCGQSTSAVGTKRHTIRTSLPPLQAQRPLRSPRNL